VGLARARGNERDEAERPGATIAGSTYTARRKLGRY
jgi:hypothetical protein